MSIKERAIELIEQIPDSKMYYVLTFLEGAAIPNEMPNNETLEAMGELERGNGEVFDGSTHDFLASIMGD